MLNCKYRPLTKRPEVYNSLNFSFDNHYNTRYFQQPNLGTLLKSYIKQNYVLPLERNQLFRPCLSFVSQRTSLLFKQICYSDSYINSTLEYQTCHTNEITFLKYLIYIKKTCYAFSVTICFASTIVRLPLLSPEFKGLQLCLQLWKVKFQTSISYTFETKK